MTVIGKGRWITSTGGPQIYANHSVLVLHPANRRLRQVLLERFGYLMRGLEMTVSKLRNMLAMFTFVGDVGRLRNGILGTAKILQHRNHRYG